MTRLVVEVKEVQVSRNGRPECRGQKSESQGEQPGVEGARVIEARTRIRRSDKPLVKDNSGARGKARRVDGSRARTG